MRHRGIDSDTGLTHMSDPHQVNSIITTAIMNCDFDPAENRIEVEKAKHMAKCIITALTNAGLVIAPKTNQPT